MKKNLLIAGVAFLASFGANAELSQQQMQAAVDAAEQKLRMTFANVSPEFVGPGPIDGLFEMIVGGRLIYFAPDQELLLFGEFYSKDGVSRTQARLSELQANKIKDLPLDKAVKIGNGPNKIIEFTDLDCPFCQAWERYAKDRKDITRYVFLMPVDSLHPTARGKSVDALCADQPGEIIGKYLQGRKGTERLQQCKKGKELLSIHESAAKRMGVTGTPTLVINGVVVAGFNQARIETLLNEGDTQ